MKEFSKKFSKVKRIIAEDKTAWGLIVLLLTNLITWVMSYSTTRRLVVSAKIVNTADAAVINKHEGIPFWLLLSVLFFIYLLVVVVKGISKGKKSANDDKACINSMKINKEYYDKIAQLVETKPVLQSVQKYTCHLPALDEIGGSNKAVVIKFKRIGGYSREHFVTNCVLFDQFECPKRLYTKLYPILEKSRKFNSLFEQYQPYDHNELGDLIADIANLSNTLKNEYLNTLSYSRSDVPLDQISDEELEEIKKRITQEHYFYYGTLLLLLSVGYEFTIKELSYSQQQDENPPSENEANGAYTQFNKPLLEDIRVPKQIEMILKQGKRTGLLGSTLLNSVFIFGNEHSIVKSDRRYFAAPLKDDRNHFFVITYEKELLGITPKKSEFARCDELFKELSPVLGGCA